MKSSIHQCFLVISLNLPLIVQTSAQDRYVDSNADWRGDGSGARPFQNVIEGVLDVPRDGSVFVRGGVYAEKMLLKKPMQLRSSGGDATIGRGVTPGFITCDGGPLESDEDGDGLDDRCEQELAERYAPIIFHSSDESNFPTTVDWFLQRTSLWFYDDTCDFSIFPPRAGDFNEPVTDPPSHPSQFDLLNWFYNGECEFTTTVYSGGTRSNEKHVTFYLKNVEKTHQLGSLDTRDWVTYFHAYPNSNQGVTIQYWRFYAYNDAFNNHGGDWEGIHVVLNSQLAVQSVGFLGHTSIEYLAPSQLRWEDTHPRVFSEGGGHATHPTPHDQNGVPILAIGCAAEVNFLDPGNPCTSIRQETWTGGYVTWCNNPNRTFCSGEKTLGGRLLNLGAKIAPMNSQYFIRYSGLWGSPGGSLGFEGIFSGYWGPAFNETGMIPGNPPYMTAWSAGNAAPHLKREWHPLGVSK